MKYLKATALAGTVALLSACGASGPATDKAATYLSECAWSKFIYISQDDELTPGTADQILAHNETREDRCG